MSKIDKTTANSPSPPDLHIPPSKHTVSVSIINTTSAIRGAKASDFFGPPIEGHEWLAAPVFCFLIQHHEYDDKDLAKPIPGKTRNLLFDLGIRKDWWSSAPLLVECLRSIDPPWTLETERSVWDILSGGSNNHAEDGNATRTGTGPDDRYPGTARNVDAQSDTACDSTCTNRNNSNIATTTTPKPIIGSEQDAVNRTRGSHSTSGETYASSTSNIDPNTIEAIIWSHHHFDHTGDPSVFPSSAALIVGPGVSDALLPGYPDSTNSTLLKSDYEGREVIELNFETGAPTSRSKGRATEAEGGRERRRFKTLKIGQLSAIDYFGDGSFYLLDTPGHAVGHICALARVTSSSDRRNREMKGPDMGPGPTVPDTFVLLAGDAFHHPGEIRPSRWLKVPETLSVSLAASTGEKMGRRALIGDALPRKHRHQPQGKIGDQFGSRPISVSQAASRSGLPSDSVPQSAPRVGMDVEDTSCSGNKIGARSDITGPDNMGRGRVVGDIPVSGACAAGRGAMLPCTSQDGHMRQTPHSDENMSVMEERTEPGGCRSSSGKQRPYELSLTRTQTTKSTSHSACGCMSIIDGTGAGGKAAKTSIREEVSTAPGEQFTLPGKVFTALLPHSGVGEDAVGVGSESTHWCGNESFYYPAGSPLCHLGLSKYKWHHNPAQAASTLQKLQEFDAQSNILVLAAHDESLLDLDPDMWYPRGTLDGWFKDRLKDKLHWGFMADFVGAIALGDDTHPDKKEEEGGLEKVPANVGGERGTGSDSLAPTAREPGMSREEQHNLMLLRRRWEMRKDCWGPVGRGGV